MIIKVIGCIIILLSCGYMGFVFSESCSRRPVELRELQGMLQMLENEISYMSNILEVAFEKISNSSKSATSAFFKQTALELNKNQGISASIAWEKSVKACVNGTALTGEDTDILISFGQMLGCTDVEGQTRNIKLVLNQLKLQERKAEELKKKNCTMFRSLGVLGGLALVIIIV